eukprot:gnl/MRDRNA2_/MRDRNA2_19302_c0_seq1.p1 gnl/MRDRNA2_/MRDRNA2_19302_c0~~gnl/MRDRNA2_/MRDRNA2_19302_c0_seq1.p1  ORF type:complete len:142 (+),score=8.10 gnl/MRDRNA2_/MRDRNA2_19302_c0_seq1:2-427(+)
MSGRGATLPVVSFAVSRDAGISWSKPAPIMAIGNGGCQNPIEGARLPSGDWGALISSPVFPKGAPRSNLTIFVASAREGFQDWASAGLLWEGHAGYSSLLAVPGSDRTQFFCLFESGIKSELEVLRLLRFRFRDQNTSIYI